MKRLTVLIFIALLALSAVGCSTQKTAQPQPSSAPEKGYVTAFGTVRCADTLPLAFPFDVCIDEVMIEEGQAAAAHTPVLMIDKAQLQLQRDRINQELAATKAAGENYRLQIAQAKLDLAKLQAAVRQMDTSKLLTILTKLANAGSRARRDPYEAMLLAALQKTDCVDQYHALIALAADKRNVADNARPVLLQMKEQLGQRCRAQQTALLTLQQLHYQLQSDALLLGQKADIMEEMENGSTMNGIGSFNSDGVLVTADRPLLLTHAPRYSGQTFAANETVAEFCALDSAVVTVNIEEQLISGITLGAEVQLSPMYDKSVVWLGTVKAISAQAIILNGETVIPVTVTAPKMTLGPGYNVVAKIVSSAK